MNQEPTVSARLGPPERQAAVGRMAAEVFDVVVVGGGVTGAGTALDAATRGLSVALVEATDFAAGTSSRSSKLIHGGLRYLEQINFTLVREALKERGLLLTRLAPHLVRPVSFLYPLQHRYWERFYVGVGVLLYDTMGGARALPRHRHLSRRAALRLAPALRPDALVGAVRYYDGQVDDARHTLVTARTAARYGAVLVTSARATGFLRDGDRVTGICVRDLESGSDLEVRGRQVVSATGVWTDELAAQVGGGQYRVRMSKGIHFTVPADRIRSGTGLILRTEKSVLFVIPWGRHWIVGTTDTDWELDRAEPAATQTDVDYLLDHVNRVLADPLGPDDIESVYVGLRPLLAAGSASTARLSREHAVFRPAPGLVAVAGGKYTTYRVMAKDTVDEAAKGLQAETGKPVPASVTAETPLLGADGYRAAWNRRTRSQPDPASISPRSSTCCTVTARPSTRFSPWSPSGRSWPSRFRAPRSTWPPRRCTPSPMKARCTWTTCWCGGPGSPSRRPTGAWPPPTLCPGTWPRSSAGPRTNVSERWRPTGPGSKPSAPPRPNPTTSPRTRLADRPPTSAPSTLTPPPDGPRTHAAGVQAPPRHAHARGSWRRPSKGEADGRGRRRARPSAAGSGQQTPASERPQGLAAFGFGLWVGVAAGLGVVQAVAEVEHGSLGVDLGEVVKVVVGWG
jgi:glycerol-3-phosphate dehydrogenase